MNTDISSLKIVCLTIIILSIITIPALAISKSDLMTSYRSTPGYTVNQENKTGPAGSLGSDTPAYLPPGQTNVLPFWKWVNPSAKPDLPSSGIPKPMRSPDYQAMNKSTSTGYVPKGMSGDYSEEDKQYLNVHFSDVGDDESMCGPPMKYIKVTTDERSGVNFTNPGTGEPYPIITDIRGNSYIVRGGCG